MVLNSLISEYELKKTEADTAYKNLVNAIKEEYKGLTVEEMIQFFTDNPHIKKVEVINEPCYQNAKLYKKMDGTYDIFHTFLTPAYMTTDGKLIVNGDVMKKRYRISGVKTFYSKVFK